MKHKDNISRIAGPRSERPSESLRSYPPTVPHSLAHHVPSPVPAPGPGSTYYSPSITQARDAYPSFISLPETLLLQASWMWRGFVDAFRWDIVVSTVASDAEVRENMFKSILLNSVSLLSIYVFDLLLQPLVRDQQKWLHRNMGWFYKVLWLFPVVGASLYLNSSWCSIVANRVYTLRHGSRKAAPSTYTGILTALATSAYRAVMICTSVVIAFVLGYVPVVGYTTGFIFFCWVDAYYCFEFIWVARGLSLAQRIGHLEERWAYYLAFGFPSSALCMWGSTLANAAVFALILPSYIIMAMHARPVPSNPYNPLPLPPTTSEAPPGSNHHSIRYPSPFIPIRVPIFAPVVWINDRVVRLLSVGSGGYGRNQQYSPRGMNSKERKKGLSDAVVESVEEGGGGGVVAAEALRSAARGGIRVTGTRRRKVQ